MSKTPKCTALYDKQELADITVPPQRWEWLAFDLERELEKTKEQLAIAVSALEESLRMPHQLAHFAIAIGALEEIEVIKESELILLQKELVTLRNLEQAVRQLPFGESPALPWCLESFPELTTALAEIAAIKESE
jgi:hypothetical protein